MKPLKKSTIGSAPALIAEAFAKAIIVMSKVFVVTAVVLGVIAIVIHFIIIPFQGDGFARISSARGVGSAVNSTIQAKHSDYLNNGDKYTLDDVLASTAFTGGMRYQATATNSPAVGDVCSNAAGDKICVNVKGKQFDWNWTAQVGDTPALLTENSTSAFP